RMHMSPAEKSEMNDKAVSAIILCLEDKVLREVARETTIVAMWNKIGSLYMTKSLAHMTRTMMIPCMLGKAHRMKVMRLVMSSWEPKERWVDSGDSHDGVELWDFRGVEEVLQVTRWRA
ncbi:ubiquitin-protein ligase, partial [Trifolium medium]|nr:ubiquitin-protein ligase [Trifolium medium]